MSLTTGYNFTISPSITKPFALVTSVYTTGNTSNLVTTNVTARDTTSIIASITENKTGLLWIPYVILAVSLISLALISFCSFHIKHGSRYRERRFAALYQLNLASMLREMREQVEMMGQTNTDTDTDCDCGAQSSSSCNQQISEESRNKRIQFFRRSKAKRRHDSLYTSNDNGSMVNLQLIDEKAPIPAPVSDGRKICNRLPTHETLESFIMSSSSHSIEV